MSRYKAGDKVRIRSSRGSGWNASGYMDYIIGTVQSILRTEDDGYRIANTNCQAVDYDTWYITNDDIVQLITEGGDMKPTQRKTYKQLKESVTVKKDALWQEACDDGTQEYVLLNADDNKDPRQTQKIYARALVEEDPENFVEVFAVTLAFMTQAELDQWDAFKKAAAKPVSRKPRVAKVAPVKATRGRKVKKAA